MPPMTLLIQVVRSASFLYNLYFIVQWYTCWQFCKIMRDVPFILLGIFILCCLWRAPFMLISMKKCTKDSERRRKILYHFAMLFVDIIDVPFAFMALIITITIWRAPNFWRRFAKETSRSDRRILVAKQFAYWLLDIPAAFCSLLVFLSIYRSRRMYIKLDEYVKALRLRKGGNSAPVPAPETEENPVPKSDAWSWHIVAFKEFGELLIDIPFPILILLTLWRMPWTIKIMVNECEDARSRRLVVLMVLSKVLIDIPCALLFIILIITGWRIPSVIEMFKTYQRGDNEHKMLLKLFGQWIIDLPFVLMLIFTFFTWRGVFLIRTLIKEGTNQDDRRKFCLYYFLIVWLDVCWFSAAVILVCLPWRLPTVFAYIKHLPRKADQRFKDVRKKKPSHFILIIFF